MFGAVDGAPYCDMLELRGTYIARAISDFLVCLSGRLSFMPSELHCSRTLSGFRPSCPYLPSNQPSYHTIPCLECSPCLVLRGRQVYTKLSPLGTVHKPLSQEIICSQYKRDATETRNIDYRSAEKKNATGMHCARNSVTSSISCRTVQAWMSPSCLHTLLAGRRSAVITPLINKSCLTRLNK